MELHVRREKRRIKLMQNIPKLNVLEPISEHAYNTYLTCSIAQNTPEFREMFDALLHNDR